MEEGIDWENLAQMMVRAIRELGERELPLVAETWVDTLPLEVFLETEQACRGFLQNGAWPPSLSPSGRMLLRLRCLFVLDCILCKIQLKEDLQHGTVERRLEIYFFEQWLCDRPQWLAQRNPEGTWNLPFDSWDI